MPARAAGLIGFAFLVACSRGESGLGAAATDSIELPAPILSARRPTVRFYLERTSDRCSAYWIDGDLKGPVSDEACPEDLALGERVRITGMTCVKDTPSTGGAPIVCPVALLRLERNYRKAQAAASSSAGPVAAPASASAAPSARAR